MFCQKCGKEQDSNSKFCINCGATLNTESNTNTQTSYNGNQNQNQYQQPQNQYQPHPVAKVDNPNHLAGVLSCCFPIVGIILYFVWKDEKPNSAKTVCYWTLGGLGISVVLYIIGAGLGILGASGY